MEARNLADLYRLPLLGWAGIQTRLDQGLTQAPGSGGPNRYTCWLATINRDGSPHVTGVGALWAEGTFWFETGDRTRKTKNLARDPRCTVSVATDDVDLVVEGTARRVTDPQTVAAMADRWAAQGWPARVDETGLALVVDYSARSAGPPPPFVFRIVARRATAVGPGGATLCRLCFPTRLWHCRVRAGVVGTASRARRSSRGRDGTIRAGSPRSETRPRATCGYGASTGARHRACPGRWLPDVV